MRIHRSTILIMLSFLAAACPACLRQYDEGMKIVFSRNVDAAYQEEILIMDIDGKNERRLTVSTGRMFNPSWSPDGRQIVFNRDIGGPNFELFIADADGGNVRQITFYSGHDQYPCVQGKPR